MYKLEEIKYYQNDPAKGVIIDWSKVYTYMDKLRIIPKFVYYPKLDFNKSKWHVLLSERSIGKTTNLILLGMCANWLYGTIIQYIREDKDMITQAKISRLFSTILEYDYVEKITQGRYNSIKYDRMNKASYYCRVEDKEIIDISPEPFIVYLSIDNNELYKSSYNAPLGDYIIFDEFISNRYMRGDFVQFCDLLKTIGRDRITPVVILSANTINKNSEYFDELGCRDYIDSMTIGENVAYTTPLGTNVYVELIGNVKEHKHKSLINSLFFGFENTKLSSITGNDWAFNNYPHLDRTAHFDIIMNNIYVRLPNKFIKIDLLKTDKGVIAFCHKTTTEPKEDAIIYSSYQSLDTRERYMLGYDNFDDLIWRKLYQNGRFYYSNNDIGSAIENYYHLAA